MSLRDLMQVDTPIGYGRQYHFKYKNQIFSGLGTLVLIVVERYARRFGSVTAEQANEFYMRLSSKYAIYPASNSVYKSISHDETHNWLGYPVYVHPHKKRIPQFSLRSAISQVKEATIFCEGSYGVIKSLCGRCRLCNQGVLYTIVCKNGDVHHGVYSKSGGICKRPMCAAIAEKFEGKYAANSPIPMAKILLELTKNGDRTGSIREIKDIALRNISKVHKRGVGKKRCKVNS